MGKPGHDKSDIQETDMRDQLSRRGLMKRSALVSAGVLLGASGLASSGTHGCKPKWRGVAFSKLLLHNFGLFDGMENRLQRGLVILIEESRIKSVERQGDLAGYKDYKILDLGGRTVLPGLIDNHVHITVPFMRKVNPVGAVQMDQQILNNFRSCVMGGVTTVRDVGGFPGKIIKFRELADRNEIPGPRVISSLSPIAAREGSTLGAPESAPYFTNPVIKWGLGGNYAERPENVRQIKEACDRMIKLGAQWLKTLHQEHPYTYYPRKLPNHSDEGYRAILEAGKRHGIKCALHEPLRSGFKKGVELGFHTLEHMPMDGVIADHDIEKFMKQGMAIMPTIMIYGDEFIGERILRYIEKAKEEKLVVSEAARQSSASIYTKNMAQKDIEPSEERLKTIGWEHKYVLDMFPNVMANLKKLHGMGAIVGAGSDIGGTPSGFFGRFSDELRHYLAAGISNFDTLRMATDVNARIIDMQDQVGTIEKGKLADMIVVQGNPLIDIKAIDHVKMVFKGGLIVKDNMDMVMG